MTNGVRCQALGPLGSFLCSKHLFLFYRLPESQLWAEAGEALADCTVLDEKGLPSIECSNFARWGDLVNAVWGLETRGHDHMEEILPRLASRLLSIDRFRNAERRVKRWKALESLTARLYLLELEPLRRIEAAPNGAPVYRGAPSAAVLWDQRVVGRDTGESRQLDVVVRTQVGSIRSFVVIECKDSKIGHNILDSPET